MSSRTSMPISVRLVLYLILFHLVWKLQLGRPDPSTSAESPGPAVPAPVPVPPKLRQDEVSALQTIVTSLELKPKLNIGNMFCNESVSTYGFAVVCNCIVPYGCWIIQITMSNVGLSGFIHEAVGYLPNLQSLILSNNKLHGAIPATLGNLMYLNTLDLSNNQLSGEIPQSIGNCTYLQYLYLHHNLLDGPIPRSLGSLKNLVQLYLHFNRLSNSIPDELGNLANLNRLDLSENQLDGPLPATLGNLKYIQTLYFPSNYLSGEFPTTYGHFPWLRLFSIAGNYITGPLPVEVMENWTDITSISLVGNNFTGKLTQKIFDLPYLQYLLVSDLSNDGFTLPSNIGNKAEFVTLVLRNCSINGSIPKYISEDMPSLRYLDLSFNNLTGGLPEYLKSDLIDMSFAGNQLNGTIPDWVLRASRPKMDFSFNNLSATEFAAPSDLAINLFACCRNSSATAPDMLHMMDPLDMAKAYCPGKKRKYHSLLINCGGEETTVRGSFYYEQDNQTSLFYVSPKKNWAYSSSGDFGAQTANSSDYIKDVKCGISVPGHASLFQQARFSPQSLRYYAFCLHEGPYNVTLHFAEIVYTKDEDYTSLRKRAFDIYIQGDRKIANFDIIKTAQSPNKPITKNFSVLVAENGTLEIHLYWPGKGSYEYMPSYNGPLISAITVMPEFTIEDKTKPVRVASISVASVTFPLLLLVAFAWKMDWLGTKESPKIKIGTEKDGDVIVTLKKLIRATGGFKEKIGTGGFGTVYKAEVQLPTKKYTVAVKKLSSDKFKEKKSQLLSEISNMTKLEHENLVKLWDFHIDKSLQILVYEYMEHKSLDKVLSDENSKVELDWPIRVNICLGIAKGLEYLHSRHPKLVHMNIKAASIFLDENWEAKISDFGFAHIYSEEDQFMLIKKEHSREARDGGGYMAPEYFRGEKITAKADVYSFGVLMLEIISGRRNVVDKSNREAELLLTEAHKCAQNKKPEVLADTDLKSTELIEVIDMVNLAVECTSHVSAVRPTMSQVLSKLSPKGSPQQVSEKTPSKGTDDGSPNPSPLSTEASTSRSPSMIQCQEEKQNTLEISSPVT